MARTGRLLEVLIALQGGDCLTVAGLAARFGVSRRTMLRDLHELSALGVPLAATPGPHGGYALLAPQRLGPFALTAEEAIALVLSYEAFEQYPHSPFAPPSLSAITKLRAALPPAVSAEIDRVRRHLAVLPAETVPAYDAPHLPALLQAAVAGQHLAIVYESRAGRTERVIYPFGLYASAGFWYCACHDDRRDALLSLRADRVLAATVVADRERPAVPDLRDWLRARWTGAADLLPLRLRVSAAARRQFDFTFLNHRVETGTTGTEEGQLIEAAIPAGEVDYYAGRLLPMGPGVRVESPPALIARLRERAAAVLAAYALPAV